MVRAVEQEQEIKKLTSMILKFKGFNIKKDKHGKSLSTGGASDLEGAAGDEGDNGLNSMSIEDVVAAFQAREKQLLNGKLHIFIFNIENFLVF